MALENLLASNPSLKDKLIYYYKEGSSYSGLRASSFLHNDNIHPNAIPALQEFIDNNISLIGE